MLQYINNQIIKSYEVKKNILDDRILLDQIISVSKKMINVYKNGNKTLIAGNGGSAADAQHLAGEFVSRFYFDRPGIPSIALTTDTSILTAIGNDYSFAKIFSRQIQAIGNCGDMFIGITTSGNSVNILEAFKTCKEKGIITVCLTGNKITDVGFCDYCIKIPSSETPRIQESHILIGHIICSIVEEQLFGKGFED
ncbi:D-sedoheptulose 7-phosphate isomerase [Dehalobacter sp. CF]|jgi:Phosphoheptose isomerase|uniref:D-sedoheptulose-7-phosphate isomerase n=1 Tax=Dehalobacter sp. CF TaxID=1131462 RepID=UPI00028A513C|nr:D-sedoheptulose 7-phosphate isomerase [Dehalobacter sp. CF]AFV05142.1 Phosphoheptose isomerase 2 [Dehalobacter sp. CF]